MCQKFGKSRYGDAAAAGERFEHVRKKYAVANGRNQRGAGDGGSAGAGGLVENDAARDWHADSQRGFAARRALEFLYGDIAHPTRVRFGGEEGRAALLV